MQCQKFNEDWTFEKADQADRLKAFYGNSDAVAVTLPHDAMTVSYTHLFGRCRHLFYKRACTQTNQGVFR